jgi:hypothetical protein
LSLSVNLTQYLSGATCEYEKNEAIKAMSVNKILIMSGSLFTIKQNFTPTSSYDFRSFDEISKIN